MTRILLLGALVAGVWWALWPARQPGQPPIAVQVTLAALAAEPARWDRQRVTVTGTVIDRVSIMGVGGVRLGDGAGHEVLAAGWTGAVVHGRMATVTGEYRLALTLGQMQVPVILAGADPGG